MIFSLEPRNFAGKEDFAYWEDFFTNEELQILKNLPEWSDQNQAQVGGLSTNGGIIQTNIRRTKVSWMVPNNDNLFFWNKMSMVVSEVNRRFFGFDLTGFYEPAQLGCYLSNESGFYDWHTDAVSKDAKVPRKLSVTLLLSDPSEFTGGELQIKATSNDAINVEQKAGRAWFFPSYMLHKVTPVTSGTRKSIVLWVGGPAFK